MDEAEGIIVTTTPFHPKEHLEMQFSRWLSGKSSATTIQCPEARNPNFLHRKFLSHLGEVGTVPSVDKH